MKKYLYYFLSICIIGLSAFTHLYRIDQTYIFQNDEGRDALIAYKMIDSGKPILLGPETSVGNMYLGPLYYYFLVPALHLSDLSPSGPAIFVAVVGIMTTILLLVLGSKLGSAYAGIWAALFYAVSPVMVHYSRSSWNPNIIPFFASLLLLIYPTKKIWQAFLFGLITGVLFQLHYVSLILPGLCYLHKLWIASREKNWNLFMRHTALIILGFFVATAPFWVFEIRHEFVNTQAFFNYLIHKSADEAINGPSYFERLWANIKLVISGIIGSQSLVTGPVTKGVIVLGSLTIVVGVIITRGLLGYCLLGSLVIVSLLKESVYVHYVSFLFPIISLLFGFSLVSKGIPRLLATLLSVFLIFPTYQSLFYNLHEKVSTEPKRAQEVASYINRQAAGRPYNVVNSQGSYTTTINYYLAISDNPPKNELQDLIFDICVGGPCPNDDETTVLLFLTGPAHPALVEYLGHPQLNEYREPRKMTSNAWVAYDVYVATLTSQR